MSYMKNTFFNKFPNIIYRTSQDGKQLNEMLSETEPEYMVIEPKRFKRKETLKDTNNRETFGRTIKIVRYLAIKFLLFSIIFPFLSYVLKIPQYKNPHHLL